jgi:hypothetical protein
VNPFDYFERIVCICGEHETKRWEHCTMQFEKLEIADRVERLSDFPPPDEVWMKFNMPPCEYSHYRILKSAIKDNLENVFIFESDFNFINYDLMSLGRSVRSLNDVDWKLFFLGGVVHSVMRVVNESLINASYSTAHSYAVNGKCFEDIVGKLEQYGRTATIDQIYRRHRKYKIANDSFGSFPMFCNQFSEIDDGVTQKRATLMNKAWKRKVEPRMHEYLKSNEEGSI